MRRFALLGHRSTRAAVLTTLQHLGIAHVEDAATTLPTDTDLPTFQPAPDGSAVEDKLQTAQQCLSFIERFAPKRGVMAQLREPRLQVTKHTFDQTIEHFALDALAGRVRDQEGRLAATRAQITKNEVLSADLVHWEHLDCDCAEIRSTVAVDISLAVVDTAALDMMTEELAALSAHAHVEVLERGRPSSYLLFFALKTIADDAGPILKKYGCRIVDFSGIQGTPQEARRRLIEEIRTLKRRIFETEAEAMTLASDLSALHMLVDHYTDAVETTRVHEQMLHTEAAYYLTGWVPAAQEATLHAALRKVSAAISCEFADPDPEDEPPILLENGTSQPFELLTGMYGTPTYRSTDPTPWLSPWFAMFFGLCLTDAGYGMLLMSALVWALMQFKLEGSVRALVKILLFGSACTIVAGAVTGGWFGIAVEKLPEPLAGLVLLNPMVDGMQALLLTLGIGIVHVSMGLVVMLLHNLRHGRIADALFDQVVWLVFIPCLSVLAYTYVGTVESASLLTAASRGAMICTGIVILTGHREGSLLQRAIMGPGRLYDIVGYFGDVLSYSRLFALGLATGAIGSVTNILAGQAFEGMPWGLGYVIAPLILLLGHGLNIAINALGAFIHSMRLQYIEFFQKFFQDGGRPFRPFAEARAYTAIEPG